MNFITKLSSTMVAGVIALTLTACKEPSRSELPVKAHPVFDIIKSIQAKDFELFQKHLTPGSEAAASLGTPEQFLKLYEAIGPTMQNAEGWSMPQVKDLSAVLDKKVITDTPEKTVIQTRERNAYDIVVTLKGDKKPVRIARVYAEGNSFKQHAYVPNSAGGHSWETSYWDGTDWNITQFKLAE